MNYLKMAKNVIDHTSSSLNTLSANLPEDFESVVKKIISIEGRVILVGMGKSGYIAKKIASSLASTGTPSFFVHPAEASHGDLGMITKSDIVIMLSNSGETLELNDTMTYCKKFNVPIIAITMKKDSPLALSSNYLLLIPELVEASSVSAPTTSALLMLALGDALVICLHEARGFSESNFKTFHPGGKLGLQLNE
jgi:arabinose-5-phosphate isomerase